MRMLNFFCTSNDFFIRRERIKRARQKAAKTTQNRNKKYWNVSRSGNFSIKKPMIFVSSPYL
jgi:hypothetical protein